MFQRFIAPVANQSPDRKTCANGVTQYVQNVRERPNYHHSSHPNGTKESIAYSPAKNSHYQETNQAPSEQNLKYIEIPGRIPISQTNGSVNAGNAYSHNFGIGNGDLNKHCPNNADVKSVPHNNGQGEIESKKEDKWGSLKRAGKKYSNFKNILSNKFTKPEIKESSADNNSTLQTQTKGTSSHDLPKNTQLQPNGDVLSSERFHNGENHVQENKNFQRTLAYGSLKTKLDGPPQQRCDAPLLITSERQSGRLIRNPNGSFTPQCSYGNQVVNGGKPNGILAQKRAGSCSHLGAAASEQIQPPPSWASLHRSDDNLTRPLASDQSYPERNALKPKDGAHVHFHSSREVGTGAGGGVSGGSDSGRGTGGGSATEFKGHDTSLESGSSNRVPLHGHSSGNILTLKLYKV